MDKIEAGQLNVVRKSFSVYTCCSDSDSIICALSRTATARAHSGSTVQSSRNKQRINTLAKGERVKGFVIAKQTIEK